MNSASFKRFTSRFLLGLCLMASGQTVAPAQGLPEPERSELLNGLRVLLWSRPGPDVLIKLRIHSGAAFDLAGKEGGMALLGDILFPDPTTREFLTEEMQGRLHVATDYDSITITMAGKAKGFERIVEMLRTALVTTQLTQENFIKIRDGRAKVVKDTTVSPATVADRAIAARLFGDFPYGRPYSGTPESLERLDRHDLTLARERFLNPNNATLVVIGDIQPARAKRTLRQLLGGWRKSEVVVPATFRQPEAPDPRILIVNTAGDQSADVRLAVRGFARNDKDAAAATLLAAIARKRWEKLLPELSRSPVFVRSDGYGLPGMFVMGTTVDNLLAAKSMSTAKEAMRSFLSSSPTSEELEQVKSEAILSLNKSLESFDGRADAWLDVDTYRLPPVPDQIATLIAMTPADLQRAASRLFRDVTPASIAAGNSEILKPQLERLGKVELLGEIVSKPPAQPVQGDKLPTKPATKPE